MNEKPPPKASEPRDIRSLSERQVAELPPIKGSRFLATATPLSSKAAVDQLLDHQRQLYRGARHHCFAWRIGESFRQHDDGEPTGTAGRPILQQIDARRLTEVLVVVSRYFGGTKLGTGGLIRAYGGAARMVLESAKIISRPITRPLKVRFPYELTPTVERILHAHSIQPGPGRYDHQVSIDLAVPLATFDVLTAELEAAGSGRIQILGRAIRS